MSVHTYNRALKMSELEKLQKVLNPSIKISKVSLSYVNRLFPEFCGSACIILHKEQTLETTRNNRKTECTNEDQTSQLDVTGSPLEYSFGNDKFDDTILLVKRHFYREEERYLPLNRREACNSLNACLGHIDKNISPIFALCDGTDIRASKLLGTIIHDDLFTTIEVYSTGVEAFAEIKNSASVFFEDHLKLSCVQEHDVTVSAFNTFDLFGTKEEMIDWNENMKSTFEGSISVEVESSSLLLYPPTRATKNNLVVQALMGSHKSPLKELWKQLMLLNQYLLIIEEYKNNINSEYNPLPLAFPDKFVTPYGQEHDEIMDNLKCLLKGDYNFPNIDRFGLEETIFSAEENADNIKLEQHIQNLRVRYNLDFTDHLWELLIQNRNYFQITKCLQTILKEVDSSGCLTQVNFTNATRFARVISNPHPQQIISHLLSGSLPLEYLVDMGLEKLSRDYMYILLNAKFGELHNIQQRLGNVSSEEFRVDTSRKRLISMAQIHMCLEFMAFIQNALEFSTGNLRTLFPFAFEQFVCDKSPIRYHKDLHQDTIYSLTAPLPISMINDLNKGIPATRRITLTSGSKLSQLATTRYYSQLPIFPTSMYQSDDSNTMDEIYHVTTAIRSSNKYN